MKNLSKGAVSERNSNHHKHQQQQLSLVPVCYDSNTGRERERAGNRVESRVQRDNFVIAK